MRKNQTAVTEQGPGGERHERHCKSKRNEAKEGAKRKNKGRASNN